MSKAKELITGVNEAGMERRGPGGMRPGPGPRIPGPGGSMLRGHPGETDTGDKLALAHLVILDLLNALGNEPYSTRVADLALKGDPITPDLKQHFLDEAPKYADKMSPEVNELMGKIAQG